jgi:hypothetical protein
MGDMENISIAVLMALADLVPREDKLLDILPRPLPAPDELVVVFDRKIQLHPHDLGRLRALFEV